MIFDDYALNAPPTERHLRLSLPRLRRRLLRHMLRTNCQTRIAVAKEALELVDEDTDQARILLARLDRSYR